jgi:hypothetical protein
MRTAYYFLITLFAALQASLTIVWMKTDVTQQFVHIFQAFNGAVPNWTALAFSFGWYWLALPLASFVWLLMAWCGRTSNQNAKVVTVLSLIGFLSMIYAMYPLHSLVDV